MWGSALVLHGEALPDPTAEFPVIRCLKVLSGAHNHQSTAPCTHSALEGLSLPVLQQPPTQADLTSFPKTTAPKDHGPQRPRRPRKDGGGMGKLVVKVRGPKCFELAAESVHG